MSQTGRRLGFIPGECVEKEKKAEERRFLKNISLKDKGYVVLPSVDQERGDL